MDPNAEIKRTKGTRYVNADWSDYSRTKRPGLQEVAVETVVYADGRIKEFILDGGGDRYPQPVRQDFDEDQRKAWEAQKKDQPTEATTAASKRTAREEAEIAANAALPADQDPASETNKERKERADRVIKEQGAAARQAQIDADAKAERDRQAKRQEEADARAQAERERIANKPQLVTSGGKIVVLSPDGTKVIQTIDLPKDPQNVQIAGVGLVRVNPDGSHEVLVPAKPEPTKTVDHDGQTYEQIRDPKTGEIIEERPVPRRTTPTKPLSYPEMKQEYNSILAGYTAAKNEAMARVASGEWTKAQATAHLEPIHQEAELRVQALNSTISTQQSLYTTEAQHAANQQSTANQRLTAAHGLSRDAMGILGTAGNLAPGTGASAARAAWSYLQEAQKLAARMGGMRDVPLPARPGYLQAAYEAAPPFAPPGAPDIGDGAAPASTPGYLPPPDAAPVDPQALATGEAARQQSLRANPAFRPSPPVEGSVAPPVISDPRDAPGYTGPPIGMAPAGAAHPVNPSTPTITVRPDGTMVFDAASSAPQQGPSYLEGASAPPPPPDPMEHMRNTAGDLLGLGFPPDVVEEAHRRRFGQPLFGGRG